MRLRVLVVAAPLVGEPRVVRRLGELAARLRRRRRLEGLRGLRARLVVPVVGLVVPVEHVERGAELLLRRDIDVRRDAARAAAAAAPADGAGRLLGPTAAAEAGDGDDDPRGQNASDVLHGLALLRPGYLRRWRAGGGVLLLPLPPVSWRTSIFSVAGPVSTGCHSEPAEDERRRVVVEAAVRERGRAAKLVDDVVFGLVVLREPLLAVARVLVEVLVLDRVVEAALERRLRLVALDRLRGLVEVLEVVGADLRPGQRVAGAGHEALLVPVLGVRRLAEVVDEVAPHEARARRRPR